MKVYAVWNGSYEDVHIEEMFATREMAEAAIEKDTRSLRRRWQREMNRAGKPNLEGARIQVKQPDGTIALAVKLHNPPPAWEDYLRMHEKPWIEEYEVHQGWQPHFRDLTKGDCDCGRAKTEPCRLLAK